MIARVRVVDNRPLTPTTRSVRFTKPQGFSFRPVQFVGLELPTDEGGVEYSMSLATSPTREHLEFGARISDTPWKQAFANLEPGDEAEIDGPYGHFVLNESAPAVFLVGGIGITPIKGMIEYATDKRLRIPLSLVYSNRSPGEIAYRTDLDELAAHNANLKIIHTITRPQQGNGWKGRTGRIDEALVKEVFVPDGIYYLCGVPAMVEKMVRLLRDLRVPTDRVVYEAFWGYE